MISPTVAGTLLQAVLAALKIQGKNKQADSLVSFTKAARVEPITILDDQLQGLSYTGDILQTALSVFTAYYLQAVALLGTIGSVKAGKILDKLSPERGGSMNFDLESMAPDLMRGLGSDDGLAYLALGHALESEREVNELKALQEKAAEASQIAILAKMVAADSKSKSEKLAAEAAADKEDATKARLAREAIAEAKAVSDQADKDWSAASKAQRAYEAYAKIHGDAKVAEDIHQADAGAVPPPAEPVPEEAPATPTGDEALVAALSEDSRFKEMLTWATSVAAAAGKQHTVANHAPEAVAKIAEMLGNDEAHSKAASLLAASFIDTMTKEMEKDKAKRLANAVRTETSASKLNDDLRQPANLAVGRVYDVKITENGNAITIPVTVRLQTNLASPSTIVNILSDGAHAHRASAKERKMLYKMGDLSLVKDIILAGDMIKEHKRALVNDQSGLYQHMTDRRARNQAAAIRTLEPGVGQASSIAIISDTTLRHLERAIGAKFSNYGAREAVFDTTNLMLLFVIYPDLDLIKLYTRGIKQPSDLSPRDIKQASKGGGIDVGELMSLLQSGRGMA